MLKYLSDNIVKFYINAEPKNKVQKLILHILKGKDEFQFEAEYSSTINFFEKLAEKGKPELNLISQKLKSSHFQESSNQALKLAQIIFPEHKLDYSEASVAQIRAKRKLDIKKLNQDGLIMRHDKQSLIRANIEKSNIQKLIGDYERILFFSYYSDHILDDFHRIKNELCPFTAAFISRTPFLEVYFRSLLKGYKLAIERPTEAEEFLSELELRLTDIYQKIEDGYYQNRFEAEKRAWNDYYDLFSQDKRVSKNLTELLEKIKL